MALVPGWQRAQPNVSNNAPRRGSRLLGFAQAALAFAAEMRKYFLRVGAPEGGLVLASRCLPLTPNVGHFETDGSDSKKS